jgi:hypothetical protein
MNHVLQMHETEVLDQAMTAFLRDAINAKGKHQKIKHNMACRRKLEVKWEEKRLAREISEFDFN